MPPARPAFGFTLWELLYAVAIAAVVLGLGVPALRDIALDAKRLAAVHSLVGSVRFARTEAQKRRRTIVLCASFDLQSCAGVSDFTSGWIVFENTDGDQPPQRAAGERLLRVERPSLAGTAAANRAAFEFRPFPRRSTNGTIDYCDPRGDPQSRAVIVSYTGRPRIADATGGRCGGSS